MKKIQYSHNFKTYVLLAKNPEPPGKIFIRNKYNLGIIYV